jgi:glyoxylase-like metal-dependent hydrolase (beta-lactamase superfamily II)
MPVKCQNIGDVQACRAGTVVGDRVLVWVWFYRYKDILVDGGPPNVADEILPYTKRIRFLLITHHHEDHVGVAPLLEGEVRILAPAESLELLRNPPKIPMYRQIVWGQPSPFEAEPLPEELVIDDEIVRVIETPGHSKDHVTFLIGKYAFVGDLVNPPKQVVAFKGENHVQIIESLEELLGYDFEVAFGGTGVYSRKNVVAYLDYLKEMRGKVVELYHRGYSIEEIVKELFPNPPKSAILFEQYSEGEWSRLNFVKSFLGINY